MSPVPTDRRSGGPIPLRMRTGIRVVAGSFLIATGGAKIPVIAETAAVVSAITGWGEWGGRSAACAVIAAEIGVGALLLSGVAIRFAATAGGVLMTCFLGALGSLLLRGMELDCRCFGIIGLQLPPWGEILLDLSLLATFILLRRGEEPRPDWGIRRGIAVAFVIVTVSCSIAGFSREGSQGEAGGGALLRRIGWDGGEFPRLLLVLDHRSLSCSLCFDDLISLCDSLSGPGGAGWSGTLTLLRRGEEGSELGAENLIRWARETGIGGEIRIVDGAEIDPVVRGESVAYLLSRAGGLRRAGAFPLGSERRRDVLAVAAGESFR